MLLPFHSFGFPIALHHRRNLSVEGCDETATSNRMYEKGKHTRKKKHGKMEVESHDRLGLVSTKYGHLI